MISFFVLFPRAVPRKLWFLDLTFNGSHSALYLSSLSVCRWCGVIYEATRSPLKQKPRVDASCAGGGKNNIGEYDLPTGSYRSHDRKHK